MQKIKLLMRSKLELELQRIVVSNLLKLFS